MVRCSQGHLVIFLLSSPRPPIPLSLLLTEEEAALSIQSFWRAYLVSPDHSGIQVLGFPGERAPGEEMNWKQDITVDTQASEIGFSVNTSHEEFRILTKTYLAIIIKNMLQSFKIGLTGQHT